MSITLMPADIIRLITSYLEMPGIHALSTTAWHFQKMLCGNPDFWWYLVRQQLTEDPTLLRQDNVNVRQMLGNNYYTSRCDSRVIRHGRACFIIEDCSKYLLEKYVEEHIDDLSNEEYACFVCALAEHGHLEAFKDYRERQDDVSHRGLIEAAQHGHLDIVKYIVEKRDISSDTLNDDDDNYEEGVEYIPGVTSGDLLGALYNALRRPGNLSIIKYLADHNALDGVIEMHVPAAISPDYVAFLNERGTRFLYLTMVP